MQTVVDAATLDWGVEVTLVELGVDKHHRRVPGAAAEHHRRAGQVLLAVRS